MKRYWFVVLVVCLLLAVPARSEDAPQPKQYKAHVTGYAHIDMAWLWRWEESTYDIMFNTFNNQLRLMEQHPEFTFAQDQAVVYEMMEKFYPEIYKGIQQRVKTGQWIPVSSGWTQMDENMPDGESLVRQFLYGQKATKERFGRYVRIAWQPDVFGHPASMPQIAHKAGIEWYLFGRPANPQRPPIFWWQSPDGSRVLAYNPPGWYTQEVNHENFTVKLMNEAKRVGVKDMLVLFGQGDHGGGPNPTDMVNMAALRNSPNDVGIRFSRVEDYFELLLAGKKEFPVWPGEHNTAFEGCYTTQVNMKRNNRKAEQLLLAAEKMSEWARFGNYRDYFPSRDVGEAWKLTLLNQTHDLLPGSGIGPIYKDAAKQYEEIFERGNRALKFSLQSLGLQLDTRGEGIPLVVYNVQSWDRTELVTAEVAALSLPRQVIAKAGDEVVPVQILKPAARDGAREIATIAFVASVPQMGLKLYRILPAPAAPPASGVQAGLKPRPFIENEFLRVEVNPATGDITRVYDKQMKREALSAGGTFLVALEDTAEEARKNPEYAGSAWNIGLTGVKWEINQVERIELVESGPARATLRVVRRFRDSLFTEEISLAAKVPRVDVESSADFYERSTFVKAGVAVAASGTLATEIPYGALELSQTGKERVMGKWVDLSGADYGVAILNNGRHGFDAAGNTIRISMIRGPWGPDPRADEGHRAFGYSIYPHRGGWREGKVQRAALSFNAPLLALQEPIHHSPQEQWAGKAGGLPSPTSFIKVASDHVLLTAMKQMEGFYDTDAILRFVECEGREGNVAIELPFKVKAQETDLLEDTIGPVGEGARLEFRMKPWEIKTLRLARVP